MKHRAPQNNGFRCHRCGCTVERIERPDECARCGMTDMTGGAAEPRGTLGSLAKEWRGTLGASDKKAFVALVERVADELDADEGYIELAERLWHELRALDGING